MGRRVQGIRRSVALLVSVGLILAIGTVGLVASTEASRRAERLHRSDRRTLQRTLASLTGQYLKFAFKESFDFANSRQWALTADDPGDRAALDGFLSKSALLQQGAAVVGLNQTPLTVVARPPGLPAPDDPGFGPLVRGLLAGQPGLSSVMHVDATPVVALGIPIMVDTHPVAVLVTFFNAATSPLERYTQHLRYGHTDHGYIVDSEGASVGASRDRVGERLPASPGLARLKNGHGGFREFRRDGHKLVESFEPVGVGGWGVVTEQQASEFFGPIRTSRVRVNLALLALLLAAASGLAVLSHKRALAMARINHQAFHDTLTGLANRALFLSRLDAALARARRHGGDVAVLFLDLDRFKVVNDSLGHDAGDAVLIEAANRIAANIRADETFARMGGDEFTILIESSDGAHDAARIAERILKVLDVPMTVNGQEVLSSASIGIAVCVDGLDSADDLVRDADLAMYRAKDHGRARYELFEVAMGETARHKLEFENALRRAIDHGELVMHYQPVVNLETGEVVAAEALVRWQHPQRGLLPPSEFMPIAEETGLCIPLGRWVLHTALTQLQAWTALAPERRVRMNVNLGPGQIRSQTLVSDVADALSATGADPSLVVLELSETTIMDDTNAAIDRLDQLRALGVELAIDDFGTGYASISWLKRLPVTVLKLDGVFVRDIETDPDDAAIARSLIDLARQLNIRVTAERVETGGQMLALRAMGCSLGQGHLFSPPVDALHFASLLHVGTLVDRV